MLTSTSPTRNTAASRPPVRILPEAVHDLRFGLYPDASWAEAEAHLRMLAASSVRRRRRPGAGFRWVASPADPAVTMGVRGRTVVRVAVADVPIRDGMGELYPGGLGYVHDAAV
jgi:hypothetical protein